MTTATSNRFGLDAKVPETGIAADAYNVATTATMLYGRTINARSKRADAQSSPWLACARHSVTLHRISGRLHRIAERQCNEDLTCPECRGNGCRACADKGNTLGRMEARLEAGAQEIAEHYGCRAYFQGDPRGCALYLIPEETIPDKFPRDESRPAGFSGYQNPDQWVRANYNRGHAVARLGQ